jgi:dihydrofolate synthase/folylpolyglutamate synthase
MRYVHVAGTNGKGSVAAMIGSILTAAGHKTGLYTSPHLHRFVERIRINGRPVSEVRVARRVADLEKAVARGGFPELSFFETATLIAFELFQEQHCEIAVLEVGLGGRLDATNVVMPDVTVITRLALEHEDTLGSSLEAIAREKAGIMKQGVPLVCGVRTSPGKEIIEKRAEELQVPVWWLDTDFAARPSAHGRIDVRVKQERIEGLRVRLLGAHQVDNAATAVAACFALRTRGFTVPDEAIHEGIRRTKWPGRLERIPGKPPVILDSAHNPDACTALGSYLSARRPKGPRVLVFGAMKDKDHEAMLQALDGLFDQYIFTEPTGIPRAASADKLAERRFGKVARGVKDALYRARRAAGDDGEVVVAGSIFLVAEARAELLNAKTDPPLGQ